MQLQDHADDFEARGATVLGVSVDGADDTRALATKESIEFPLLLSDVEMARSWQLAETPKPVFKPTTLVIDRSGIVRFSFIGERAADRPELTQILDTLDQLGT